MTDYIFERCQKIFSEFFLHPNTGKIQFTLLDSVTSINFTNTLNFILGFKENQFTQQQTTYMAENKPQINRGLTNMYIYTNICCPTYVGQSLVPLLKNVFIEQGADVRNYIVRRPMYIPVSSSTFSHVEINIRNDAGQLVTFPRGAITYLTLHFRKHKQRYN